MRKRWTGMGLFVAVLTSAGIIASNQGFRVVVPLQGPGASSATGTQSFCLPYLPSSNLTDAASVRDAIDAQAGAAIFVSLSRLEPTTGSRQVYDGTAPTNFQLGPGEGYLLRVTQDIDFRLLGSDDPTQVVALASQNDGATEGIDFCPPYNGGPQTASELISDIEASGGSGSVISVERYIAATDTYQSYAGLLISNDFTIEPGQSYIVKTNRSFSYVPSRR